MHRAKQMAHMFAKKVAKAGHDGRKKQAEDEDLAMQTFAGKDDH